jgi:hypothetical protein
MSRTTKFIENKICKTCGVELNFKKFRITKALKKGPNKGKFMKLLKNK